MLRYADTLKPIASHSQSAKLARDWAQETKRVVEIIEDSDFVRDAVADYTKQDLAPRVLKHSNEFGSFEMVVGEPKK